MENKEFKRIVEAMSTEDLMYIVLDKMKAEIEQEEKEEKQEIKEVKKELKNDGLYSGYLKGFNEEFETHLKTRIKETPILLNLFRNMMQSMYKPTKLYKVAVTAKSRIEKDLTKNMSKEQKHLFEQYNFCEDIIQEDEQEQAFIFGYSLSQQLKEEIKIYPHKKEE